jgi:Coenzyme PQQ synthesis protein D (PqqD)
MAFHPKRRQHSIKVEEFQGEVLVYDLDRHRAHCLNGAAVTVWRLCDGSTAVAEIAAAVAREHGGEADEDLVWRALTELDEALLLDTPLERAEDIDVSRRRALAKIGWAAAIPLVLSITVPEPALAQSVGPTGEFTDSTEPLE